MKKIIIFITISLPLLAASQKKDIRLVAGLGASKHGTGDMRGYNFLNQVDITLNKRFCLSPGLQFTNNSKEDQIAYRKINNVTAGLNVFTNLNYFLLNKQKHKFAVGAGPVVRFQHSSVPAELSYSLSPSGQEIYFFKYDKLRTISLGYNISPAYYYQYSKKISFGAKIILQNDTEADVITSALLFAGIKL